VSATTDAMNAPTIAQALSAVMADVQAVKKGDRNTAQNFSFRGIDSVVNAVGPAMRAHGVVAVPTRVEPLFESYESRGGAKMRNAVLTITWRFYGPRGDFIEAQSMGEASDSGDKSVPKAHSVAYRTLLLQALCIPTDEPDPDASVHERAVTPPADPRGSVRADIRRIGEAKGLTVQEIGDDFAAWSSGVTIPEADLDMLEKYRAHLQVAS
jgi:hypothetical protein